MPVVRICDADCKTVLTEQDVIEFHWGYSRGYSLKAMVDVDEYQQALSEAAGECRELFKKRQKAARIKFHRKYPKGKLPDEADKRKITGALPPMIDANGRTDQDISTPITEPEIKSVERDPRYET